MQGTKVIRVYPDGLKKLDRINSERPQDMSRADTFDYILRVFEESPLRVKTAGSASPIIDADNLRIVTSPITGHIIAGNVSSPIMDVDKLQNKAYMDSKRSIAERIRKGENKND